MLKEAIQYIAHLTELGQYAKTEVIDEIRYHLKPGGEMERIRKPHIAGPQRLNTLSGLAGMLLGAVDDDTLADEGNNRGWMIHVASPILVSVVSALNRTNPGEREEFALAEIRHEHFPFNRFMPQEQFIIGMLASFARTEDWGSVMALVGNLRGEKVRTDEDDGFTQVATIKQGSKMDAVEVKNPVTLRPYRTFYDVEQPAGQYVVRLQKDGDNVPQVALFEVRDGMWQHEAMQSIAKFFAEACPAYLVVC